MTWWIVCHAPFSIATFERLKGLGAYKLKPQDFSVLLLTNYGTLVRGFVLDNQGDKGRQTRILGTYASGSRVLLRS